mgnify:CR=1 FL=1
MTVSDPDPLPDVGIEAKPALLILIGLAVVYVVAFLAFGDRAYGTTIDLVASAVLASVLLALSYTDLRTGLLFDAMTLPLILLGLGYAAWNGAVLMSVAGAIVGYALVAGLAAYWRRARGYEGIGLGDAKLLAAGGAWVGLAGLPILLLIASGTGLIAALTVSKKARSAGEHVAIPFGPCLAMATWIVWCGIETLLFR